MINLLTATAVSENARAFLTDAGVAPEVLELRPDYRVLVMTAEGLEPGPSDQASEDLLAAAEVRARTALDGRAPEDMPAVADWRDAYRAFGAKPQRTRPSVEALLRRLDGGLPRIDRLTDAYNAVSIGHLVPVGGEDLDQYKGAAQLVRAVGDEEFCTVANGEPAVEHPRPGEVIWRDDAGVTCRCWNWRHRLGSARLPCWRRGRRRAGEAATAPIRASSTAIPGHRGGSRPATSPPVLGWQWPQYRRER